MKNTILNTKLFLMAICAAAIVSCSGDDGEDGAIGPQGVAGIDGTNGTDGADGSDGEDGADGNANVITSPWIDATFDGDTDSTRRTTIITDSEITPAIIDTGVVIIYGKRGSEIWSVPVNFPFLGENFAWLYLESVGLSIFCDSTTGTGVGEPYLSSFRYIVIPSGLTAKNNTDFSKMDYYEVMNHFGLEY
ncbi:collagen-like protein [Cellulophaga sp. E6(2014)]|uniref:collagen-like protein n=1 Tax=Cellulophaga sp. E6(2014) TaxID=1495334 RepID=UPI00051CD541|nr:collagen-like protein [Cellulophaga sp. E6(2014)]KGK29817.1 hypothetical protein EL45_12495 [Cellulophaga sp. E6(2014)]